MLVIEKYKKHETTKDTKKFHTKGTKIFMILKHKICLCIFLLFCSFVERSIMNENQLSNFVIGIAIEVHRQLGPGLLESAYKECLAHALINSGLEVKKEVAVPVVYQGLKLSCGYRLDLLVENKLVIEIKSVEKLNDIHMAQVLTYLKLGDYRPAHLLNFNVIRIKDRCRRIINGHITDEHI